MFLELVDLRHLILNPPAEALVDKQKWEPIARLLPCTFLVPATELKQWESKWSGLVNVRAGTFSYPPLVADLKAVLEEVGVHPYEAIYLTPDPDEVLQAANARLGTILWGTSPQRVWPDLILHDTIELREALEQLLGGKHVGYFGELVATRDRLGHPYGRCGKVVFRSFEEEFAPAVVRCMLLGRYFASGDARYHKHQYTHRILRAKTRPDPFLRDCIVGALQTLMANERIDLVTCVPPRDPSRPHGLSAMVSDAFEQIALKSRYSAKLACDLLECNSTVPQKTVPSRQRRENVRGKFRVRRGSTVSGHVVLVDDILTTGSTVKECCHVLLTAGARKVTVICLGYDQKVISADAPAYNCPQCGGTMQVRFHNKLFTPFFGCTGFPDCRYTDNWDSGIRIWNLRNTRDILFAFEDIWF